MKKQEIAKVENYLKKKFGQGLQLKASKNAECTEVLLDQEFIGTIYKDEDEGDVSYTLTISILDIDLE